MKESEAGPGSESGPTLEEAQKGKCPASGDPPAFVEGPPTLHRGKKKRRRKKKFSIPVPSEPKGGSRPKRTNQQPPAPRIGRR